MEEEWSDPDFYTTPQIIAELESISGKNCVNQVPRQSVADNGKSPKMSNMQDKADEEKCVDTSMDTSDSDDVPLLYIQEKLKSNRQHVKQTNDLHEETSEDDSYEDESYKPSPETSSEGDCSPPLKRKRKWVRKRVRPLKREKNRDKIFKEIHGRRPFTQTTRTPKKIRKQEQKKTTPLKQRQYDQHLQKALKQSRAQHTVQRILKKHGEIRISNLLTSNSLKKIDVNAGGDCYFNAVRLQLSTEYTVQELRNKLGSHLLERKDHYQSFVQRNLGMNEDDFSKMYDNKIKDIKKEGIWNVDLADLLPLATANCFNVNITIYSSRLNHPVIHISPDMKISEDKGTRNDVKLTYLAVRGYEHYDACVRKTISDEKTSSKTQKDNIPCTPRKSEPDTIIPTITPRKQAVYISPKKIQLSRKKTPNVTMWEKNVRKQNKTTGKSYISAKSKKVIEAKHIGRGCQSCRYKCTEKFPDEARKAIFNTYYDENMTYERQRDFICQHIDVRPTSKRYGQTYKHNSRTYFLPSGKERVRVCKQFFMRTLCVGDKLIRYTLGKKQHGGFAGADNRGKHTPSNKTEDSRKQYIKKHIESFPIVESHYTRKSTKRKYLSQDLTIRKMYELYKIKCQDDNTNPVSEMVYRKIFCTEYNLSFHKPKKDLCQTCNKYNEKKKTNSATTEDETKFRAHSERKERARREKERDKQCAKLNSSIYVATFDLEAVLSTPCSTVSQVYYKRKLNCYNLTFFSLSDKKGTCYIWDETHGQRGSSEIGTCVITQIMSLPSVVKHVILYSDCCSGQNRNQYLSGGLLHTVKHHPHVQVIEQKFLESGHTQMECDAMHSSIEHAKRCTAIYVPDQWDTVIHMARRQKPYTVIPMRFDSFYDLKTHTESNYKNFKTDVDGNRVNWLKVKVLRVTKEHPEEVQIKYEYDEEFRKINVTRSVRGRPSATGPDLPRKYSGKLPISEAKKKDLLELCDSLVIPAIYRGFYESIPTSKSAKDQLALPDVYDEDSDSVTDN